MNMAILKMILTSVVLVLTLSGVMQACDTSTVTCTCTIACPSNSSALKPIPEEIKDKLHGKWYYAFYNDMHPMVNAQSNCNQVTTEVNSHDVLYIDYVYTNTDRHSGKATTTTYCFGGARVDDGETTKYEWLQVKGGITMTLTLLSVTDTYKVFLQEDRLGEDGPNRSYLVVFSEAKTLTADELKAIEQVEQQNNITIKLEPAQNANCP